MLTYFKPNTHYSREIETYIIGVCLLEPKAIQKATSISGDMFYFDRHTSIFNILVEMYRQEIPIDLVTVFDYMVRGAKLPDMTPYELSKYTNEVIFGHHLPYWCTILRSMWTNRKLGRINSVQELKSVASQVETKATANVKLKHYRFLLTYFDRQLVKSKLKLFGSTVIAGTSRYRVKVTSPLLVFAMHLIDPETTWVSVGNASESMTNDQCKARFHTGARYDGNNWIDKTHKIPVAWL